MASEAEQVDAVDAALQQRDVASIARLTRAATSAAVCNFGCAALVKSLPESRCTSSEETQLAVEALLAALHVHPTRADVQAQCCIALARWCGASDVGCTVVGTCGVVEAVVTVLQAHGNSADASSGACYALAQFTLCDARNCSRAHLAGALIALLDVMRAHPTVLFVQQYGCMTLASVCAMVMGAAAAV